MSGFGNVIRALRRRDEVERLIRDLKACCEQTKKNDPFNTVQMIITSKDAKKILNVIEALEYGQKMGWTPLARLEADKALGKPWHKRTAAKHPDEEDEKDMAIHVLRTMANASAHRLLVLEPILEAAKAVIEEADPRKYDDLTEAQKNLADKVKAAESNEGNQD